MCVCVFVFVCVCVCVCLCVCVRVCFRQLQIRPTTDPESLSSSASATASGTTATVSCVTFFVCNAGFTLGQFIVQCFDTASDRKSAVSDESNYLFTNSTVRYFTCRPDCVHTYKLYTATLESGGRQSGDVIIAI